MNPGNSNSLQQAESTASGINILLGIWLIISPFIVAFQQIRPAMWNNIGVGALIAVFACIHVSSGHNQPVWSWLNAFLGLWQMLSPFALRFAHTDAAMWNNIVVGAVVSILALIHSAAARQEMRATSNAA